MTYDQIDKNYLKLDIYNETHTLPVDYFPSVDELIEHNVDECFDKYAGYLMYLSDALDDAIKEERSTNLSLAEMKKLCVYLKKLFQEFVVEG